MSTEISMDLRYHVVITREPGEDWPPLVTSSGQRYNVTKVTVTVWLGTGTGELHVSHPDVLRGRRIRKDGTLGAPIGPYNSYQACDYAAAGPLATESARLRARALREAGRAHMRLTGKDATGIFSEDALTRDKAAFLKEQEN